MSSEWSLPFRFSGQNFVCIYNLSHASYMSSSHQPWLDLFNNMWWCVQVGKPLIMQYSPALCHFLLGPNILLSTLFSNTFSHKNIYTHCQLCSALYHLTCHEFLHALFLTILNMWLQGAHNWKPYLWNGGTEYYFPWCNFFNSVYLFYISENLGLMNQHQFRHKVGPLLWVDVTWWELPRLVLERHLQWVCMSVFVICFYDLTLYSPP